MFSTMNKHEPVKQLNLKDNETYELAAKLAARHGDTLNGAVKTALRNTLAKEDLEASKSERRRRVEELIRWYSALPDRDTRSADEILGYDENGLPT